MNLQQHIPITLASASPRRQDYLRRFGLKFHCQPAALDESRLPGESPRDFVQRMAWEKAESVQQHAQGTLILAGDTDVSFEGEVLGKPQDAADAITMLQRMRGKMHEVHSGYCLLDAVGNTREVGHVLTQVWFRHLPDSWINWYVQTGEPLDKAGAYSIQGLGTVLVERIEGSYNNVVGYPIEIILEKMLQHAWISFADETSLSQKV